MRTATSGISDALTAPVSQPGYLIRISVAEQTEYLCSLDVASSFDPGDGAHIWNPTDVQLSGVNWSVGAGRVARMTLGDPDLAWWVLTLQLQLQDCPVAIWQCYAEAPNEATPLWSGRIGAIKKGDVSIDCDLMQDTNTMHAPRRRVQNIVPAKYLLPAGKVIMVGGQKWTLERKTNG